MRSSLRLVAALSAVVMLLVGCIGRDSNSAPSDKPKSQVLDRKLELKITGAIKLDFDGVQKMQFYHFNPKSTELKPASVGTVSTRTPFTYKPGFGVVVGISVVGNYTGDGKYRIFKRDLSNPQTAQSTSLSIVRLAIFDMTQDQPPEIMEARIDTDEKPCEVVLDDDTTEGTLDCPLITDANGGNRVTVTMKWGPA